MLKDPRMNTGRNTDVKQDKSDIMKSLIIRYVLSSCAATIAETGKL